MAYALHIKRQNNITKEEWDLLNTTGILDPIDQYRSHYKDMVVSFTDTDIETVGPNPNLGIPDTQWIQELKEIALKLNATIQGDDGEKY